MNIFGILASVATTTEAVGRFSMEGMIKYIVEFGILVVIAAIYLVQTRKQNERIEELHADVLKSRGAMLEEYQQIAYKTLNKILFENQKKETEHAIESQEIANNLNKEIMATLKAALKTSNVARLAYFSYHNGGKDFIGVSYQRMSCTNSVVRPGVVSVQGKFQNMFRSSLYTIYIGLQKTDHLEIIMDDIREEDPALYEMCRPDNMLAVYVHSVKNTNGVDLGFLAAVYDVVPVPEDGVHLVDTIAHRIEGVVQVAEDKTNYSRGY